MGQNFENKDDAKNTREKNRIVRERTKTILIWILCVCTVCLSLTAINMQSNTKPFRQSSDSANIMSSELTNENIMNIFLDFSEPELVIVNKGEQRGEISRNNDGYEKIIDFANKVMQSVHSEGAVYSKVSTDTVLKKLMLANSIYIQYPYLRLAEMDAQFFQIKNSAFAKNTTFYSQLFLLPDTNSGKVMVYIASKDNPNEMVRIQTENFAATLAELINDLDYINQREYAFATELNLDRSDDSMLVLDSMIAIPLKNKITASIVAELPWEYTNTLNFTQPTDYSVGLMEIFGYNPNTIRQYIDKTGALTFVSEKGTLSMDQNGVLKYKSLGLGEGVVFSSDNNNLLYMSTAGVIKTINKITALCYTGDNDNGPEIKFTGITKNPDSSLSFKLDYFVNGCKVKMNDGSAIEVTVSNGIMTDLKMQIVSFRVMNKGFENISLINAIDQAYANGRLGKRVDSAELIYEYLGIGKEMNTKWKLNGN